MSLILPAFSSPDLKAFPHCSKSSKSSEGGQSWPLRAQWRDCVPQTRLTLASSLGRWWFLVTVCACGGKTLISRLNLFPSATCRGLTSLPARCSCQPSDTASQRRKSVPTIRAVRGTPASASVLPRASSPARKYVLGLYQWQRDASYGYRLQMLLLCRQCFVTCCMTSVCFVVWMCLRLVTGSPRAFNLQFYASFCS